MSGNVGQRRALSGNVEKYFPFPYKSPRIFRIFTERIKERKEMNKEENEFVIRAYDKIELALLYSPRRNDAAALQTLYRWMQKNTTLKEKLEEIGYNKYRHRFLKQEVALIVEHLGEP